MNGTIENFAMNYNVKTNQIEYSCNEQSNEEFNKEKTSLNADILKEEVKAQISEFLKPSSFKIVESKIDDLFELVQNLIQKDYDDQQEYFKRLEESLFSQIKRRRK